MIVLLTAYAPVIRLNLPLAITQQTIQRTAAKVGIKNETPIVRPGLRYQESEEGSSHERGECKKELIRFVSHAEKSWASTGIQVDHDRGWIIVHSS